MLENFREFRRVPISHKIQKNRAACWLHSDRKKMFPAVGTETQEEKWNPGKGKKFKNRRDRQDTRM